MNKYKIDALIVVEGKTDIDFLSSFIDANFYSVNGSSVSKKDFDFINEYLKKNEVIVLTDPDFPGTKIRNEIKENCKGVSEAFVRKEKSIRKNKVGVAESEKEEVLNAIKNRIKGDLLFSRENNCINLTILDLYELGLVGNNSSHKKRYIEETFHLGYNNAKQLLKKLNLLQISKEKIEEALKNVK